jgi:hypothetical protein
LLLLLLLLLLTQLEHVLNALTILSGVSGPLVHREASIDAKSVCPLWPLPLLLHLGLPSVTAVLATRVDPVGPCCAVGPPRTHRCQINHLPPAQLLLSICVLMVVGFLCVLIGSMLRHIRDSETAESALTCRMTAVLARLHVLPGSCTPLTAGSFL